MREGHTISAPSTEWERVFTCAKNSETNISDVTRRAWTEYFKEQKNYRTVDVLIILLLLSISSLLILLRWVL